MHKERMTARMDGEFAILLQYWRSMDHLLAYAKARDLAHLPAWQLFNKAVGTDGTVGIWHETYVVKPGTYENVYVNMPAFGLGRAGRLIEDADLRVHTQRLTERAHRPVDGLSPQTAASIPSLPTPPAKRPDRRVRVFARTHAAI